MHALLLIKYNQNSRLVMEILCTRTCFGRFSISHLPIFVFQTNFDEFGFARLPMCVFRQILTNLDLRAIFATHYHRVHSSY